LDEGIMVDLRDKLLIKITITNMSVIVEKWRILLMFDFSEVQVYGVK
jgi:hypothetical protein